MFYYVYVCSLEVDSLLKELLESYSPEENVFFHLLRKIILFVAKDSTRSLEPVWKIQDHWANCNGAYVAQLHQTVISCVKDLKLEHVDYLISDIQVQISQPYRLLRPHFLDFPYLYLLLLVQARWNSSDMAQRYTLLNFIRTLAKEADYDDVPFQVIS